MTDNHTVMRYFSILMAMSLLLGLAGCTEEITARDTHIRGGLLYVRGEDQPFSGFVVGRSREGYRNETYDFKKQYRDGVLDGMTLFYYPNGKIESKVPYKNGEIHGYFIRYYENGKPRSRIHFIHGMRGGPKGEMFWDRNGHSSKS